MKVTINIINTLCIHISEAVTVPSLMMLTSIVSEESLARGTHTHTHTHNTHTLTHTHTHTHTHNTRIPEYPHSALLAALPVA